MAQRSSVLRLPSFRCRAHRRRILPVRSARTSFLASTAPNRRRLLDRLRHLYVRRSLMASTTAASAAAGPALAAPTSRADGLMGG